MNRFILSSRQVVWSFIILPIASLVGTLAMAQNSTIEGQISSIKIGLLVIDGTTLPLGGQGQSDVIPGQKMCIHETRYFTPEGYPISFETVAGVGYVQRARVLVEQGCVREVRIVEMQQ